MTNWQVHREWFRITALLPVYEDGTGGNYTEVWLEGGKRLVVKRRVETVRRQIARYLQVDEEAARRQARHVLDRSLNLPLALHKELLLVPLRLRVVRARDDGATGYVNASRVVACRKEPQGSKLILRDGTELACLNSRRRVQAALHEGRLVLEDMRRRRTAGCPGLPGGEGPPCASGGPSGPTVVSCPQECPWRAVCQSGF